MCLSTKCRAFGQQISVTCMQNALRKGMISKGELLLLLLLLLLRTIEKLKLPSDFLCIAVL